MKLLVLLLLCRACSAWTPRHRALYSRVDSRVAAVTSAASIVVDDEDVIGEGTYGVVCAASDSQGTQYVAKTARSDTLSKKYWAVERAVNEKVFGAGGAGGDADDVLADAARSLATFAGVVTGKPSGGGGGGGGGLAGLLDGVNALMGGGGSAQYMTFERVVGARDVESYVRAGACGIDGLAGKRSASLLPFLRVLVLRLRDRRACGRVVRFFSFSRRGVLSPIATSSRPPGERRLAGEPPRGSFFLIAPPLPSLPRARACA